jgi:predicted TIM-barrel fold metal-dependent hydrolase
MEYNIISSDSHVVEPHDLWQNRIEKQYKDRAPKLLREADTDRLVCDQAGMPPVGLLAGCARGDDEVRFDGRWEEDVMPGGYDSTARLDEIARDGVDAEVLYPTLGLHMYPIEDRDFQWALFRAYNSWLAEDFCGAHPERYKGIAMLNHEDVDLSIAELKRSKEMGLVGVMVPLYPLALDYADPALEPLWAAAADHEMPVSFHAATSRDKSKAWNKSRALDQPLKTAHVQQVILSMIYAGVFDRHPDLMIVSAENEAGWAGHMCERADYSYHRNRNYPSDDIHCKNEPSTYFRQNFRLTFMRDQTAAHARTVIGVETLMWGSDVPHHVSTWPNSQKVLSEHFDDIPAAERNAIVRENVRQLYHF